MILSKRTVLEFVKKLRSIGGHTIITTNGCFDVLHVGHIRYLREAKCLGERDPSWNILIVLINSDKSVQVNKGTKRPLVPEQERATVVNALDCVDGVVLFDEPTPTSLLREILPDIHVKGGDYTPDTVIEADAVRAFGGKVVTLTYIKGKSTTSLIDLVLERFGDKKGIR